MRKLFPIIVLAIFGSVAYRSYHRAEPAAQEPLAEESELVDDEDLQPEADDPQEEAPATYAKYRCDGRHRCSQMHSCEEATWFINNCPGQEMDGDNDGVPCERQWCKYPGAP